MTIWVLMLLSLGPAAVLPVGFDTRASCEATGEALLAGLRWVCIAAEKPAGALV